MSRDSASGLCPIFGAPCVARTESGDLSQLLPKVRFLLDQRNAQYRQLHGQGLVHCLVLERTVFRRNGLRSNAPHSKLKKLHFLPM